MKKSDRELLKKELSARINSSEISITLPPRTALGNLRNKESDHLFRILALTNAEPFWSWYVEGTEINQEVAHSFEHNTYTTPAVIERDILFPVPRTYHMEFSKTLCDGLLEFAQHLTPEKLFHHIKGYKSETMIFNFHDAFSGVLRIAIDTPGNTVQEFSNAVGGSCYIETIGSADKISLTKLLEKLKP